MVAIAEELVALGKRPIEELLSQQSEAGPAAISKLMEIAQNHFPNEWDADPGEALEAAIRAAIEGLDGPLRVDHRMTAQEAAYRLFNLAEPRLGVEPLELEGLDGHRYTHVLSDLITELDCQK